MRKRTRVRIRRMLFLAKLAGGTIGFIYLLCRFETFRNLAGLFLTACVMPLIGEWMEHSAEKESAHPDGHPK